MGSLMIQLQSSELILHILVLLSLKFAEPQCHRGVAAAQNVRLRRMWFLCT